MRGRVSTPIAADESAGSSRAVRRALDMEACDVVNVKLASAGGFRAAREALRLARANGVGAFLSSTLDGPWGIAAALQLAAAEDVKLACGLATLELFDAPLARALPAPRNGTLKVPARPRPRRGGGRGGARRRRRRRAPLLGHGDPRPPGMRRAT